MKDEKQLLDSSLKRAEKSLPEYKGLYYHTETENILPPTEHWSYHYLAYNRPKLEGIDPNRVRKGAMSDIVKPDKLLS